MPNDMSIISLAVLAGRTAVRPLLNLSLLLAGGLEPPAFGELPRQHPRGEQVAKGTKVGNYIALYERLLV